MVCVGSSFVQLCSLLVQNNIVVEIEIIKTIHYGGIDRNLAVTCRKNWWALWFYGQINLPT
jgi:hypothetical protein